MDRTEPTPEDADRSSADAPARGGGSNQRDELRTIAFRLREIQRLIGARVEQENRRLEAEGVEPVTGHGFFHPEPERPAGREQPADRERPEG